MSEASEALIQKVRADFNRKVNTDQRFRKYYVLKKEGKATYKDAYRFAEMVGDTLSESLLDHMTEDVFEDRGLYDELAKSILSPVLGDGRTEIIDFSKIVQEAKYEKMGLGLKAVIPDENTSREIGLSEKLKSSETFSDSRIWIGEPITNFSMSVVDDFIKANAEFQYDVGLAPTVIRTNVGGCCAWCRSLAGSYPYKDVGTGDDIWRRHERCRCTIDIRTEYGKGFQRMRTSGRGFIG